MSMDKPYRVEVSVDAPRDVVWRALTVPEQIRHWFGWDYDGLEGEIDLIFVQHATLHPPDRIAMSDDGGPLLSSLDSFRAFQKDIRERCAEPPQPAEPTIVGNYGMLA